MANIGNNITPDAARTLLRRERTKLTNELTEINRDLRRLNARRDVVTKRLKEITDGEQLLENW